MVSRLHDALGQHCSLCVTGLLSICLRKLQRSGVMSVT